jgi:Fe-S-cluster containining protein
LDKRERSLEKLCLECGLCCDGTVFTHVALTSKEATRLQLPGVLRQPCPQLGSNKHCGVYLQRPMGCSHFVCMLGRALEDGEVPLSEAVEKVREVQSLAQKLGARVPGPGPVMNRARAYESSGPDSELAVEVRQLRRSLETLIQRWFLGRK